MSSTLHQNWEQLTLGDLGRVVTGRTPPSSKPELFGDQYPFITPTDMAFSDRSIRSERGISDAGAESLSRIKLPAKTPCFVCIGATIGKLCLTSEESFTNQQINSIVVNKDRHNPDFVYYLLRHVSGQVKSLAGGAATPIINKSAFSEVPVLVPSLEVQESIASILSAYDDLIENNTRRIEILEEMARRLYEEWFVHFRFPGHEEVNFKESELGRIPEGWEVVSLSKLVSTQYGYTESATQEPVGPRFLRGMDINKKSYIDWASVPYCPVDEKARKKFCLSLGDILIIRMADPGKVGIVEKEVDAVFASYLVRLSIADERLTPYYLFYYLTGSQYQDYITGASTGTTRKSASAKVITGVPIAIPPDDLLAKFEAFISPLRRQLSILVDKSSNLRAQRDLLLPKLVSGEIDVSDIPMPEDKEVEAA